MLHDPGAGIAVATAGLPMHDPRRLPALDAIRGLVMAVMAVDHVDSVVNPRHAGGDAEWMVSTLPLSAPDFLTRWCSHLCAPAFVFLAGASLALAAARCADVAADAAFDRRTARRALLLLVLEFTYLSACFRVVEGSPAWAFSTLLPVFAQVLFAIGAGLLLLIPLRRMPPLARLSIALASLVVVEWASAPGRELPLGAMLLVQSGVWSASYGGFDVLVLYPALAWLPAMLLGHLVGERLAAGRWSPRASLLAGAVLLWLFVLVRGLDGFGNAHLHRRDGSLLEWLHCSKYPPSISFLAMTLGPMALLLAWWSARPPARLLAPLVALGQVPLFFYLLHFAVIGALLIGGWLPVRGGAWWSSWLYAALVISICWLPCMGYRRWRRAAT